MNQIDTSTEAVERLLKYVTPGPWREGQDGNLRVYGPDCCGEHSGLVAKVFKGRANTSFIAAARDLVPALLKERDEARARVSALEEITDPDFIWGAMDNVHDMDVTMDDYAKAVSRAQRAALATLKDGK